MRQSIAILVTVFALPAIAENSIPVISGHSEEAQFRTTLFIENASKEKVTCRFELPNEEAIRTATPNSTEIYPQFLRHLTTPVTARVDCPDDVDLFVRIQTSRDGGRTWDRGRFFMSMEPASTPRHRMKVTSDLVVGEFTGKPADVRMIIRRGEVVTQDAGVRFEGGNLTMMRFGDGRQPLDPDLTAEFEVVAGEGRLAVGEAIRDARFANELEYRERIAFAPKISPENMRAARMLGIAPFKAAPFQDPATGLIYMRERWYDPRTGTFMTPDPMGYRDSSNSYAYCGGDPINCTDPTGTYGIDFHYAVTEFLAINAGLHPHDAKIAGAAAQFPDDVELTAPVANTLRYARYSSIANTATLRAAMLMAMGLPRLSSKSAAAIGPARKRAAGSATMLRLIHFPQGDMNPAAVERYSQAAQRQALLGLESGDAWTMGLGLHTLQDSFSHEGLPSLGFAGHPWGRGGPASHEADATHDDVRRALSAAEVTYQYLVAFGTRDPSRRIAHPRPWNDIAAELYPYLAMTSRNQKRTWMETRGVYLGDDYWRHVGVGPDDDKFVDRLDRLSPGHISINEKYLRWLAK